MTASMQVVDTPIDDVVVNFRLRSPSDKKVFEIAESINQIGSLINPITIDKHNNLLAGFHRFLAYKKLGYKTIPSIVKDVDKKYGELVEIHENLKRNELNHIEVADHIVRSEELLVDLGLTYAPGHNQHTLSEEKLTIADIAEGIGFSKRSYQKTKQIARLHPEVKDQLVETEWADYKMELVKLSSEKDDIQKGVCRLLISGKCRSWKQAFYEAKMEDFKLHRQKEKDFVCKERWGQYPKSIMKFNRENDDLKKICDLVNHDEDLRLQKSSMRFGETKIKLHQMNPEHSRFALDYYTNPDDLILDPFNGRGTTAFTALHLNRKFIGFEICNKSYKLTKDAVEKHIDVSEGDFELIKGCGCEMKEFEGQGSFIDAVFSSPPYYLNAEPYASESPLDLCNMGIEEFDSRIDLMFKNLKRVIKKSDYKKKIFHPIMMVVGTARDAENGIQDMSFTFQKLAKKHGLILWDVMHLELNNPHLVCSLNRNYEFKFTHKSHETQLTWVRF
mgnify:FL=1